MAVRARGNAFVSRAPGEWRAVRGAAADAARGAPPSGERLARAPPRAGRILGYVPRRAPPPRPGQPRARAEGGHLARGRAPHHRRGDRPWRAAPLRAQRAPRGARPRGGARHAGRAAAGRAADAKDGFRRYLFELAGRRARRGGADPAVRDASHRLPLVAGGLRARLRVLRDRRARARPLAPLVGDRRAAPPRPRGLDAAGDGRRLHGPGRAVPQLRRGARGGLHAVRSRRRPHRRAAHLDLDRRASSR